MAPGRAAIDHAAMGRSCVDAYEFLRTRTPRHIGWEIPIIFYAAMHAADELLLRMGCRQPTSHARRERLLAGLLPTPVCDAYRDLSTLDKTARYEEGPGMTEDARDLALRLRDIVVGEVRRQMGGAPGPA